METSIEHERLLREFVEELRLIRLALQTEHSYATSRLWEGLMGLALIGTVLATFVIVGLRAR